MPRKMVECEKCDKVMRSDNLKRHMENCLAASKSKSQKKNPQSWSNSDDSNEEIMIDADDFGSDNVNSSDGGEDDMDSDDDTSSRDDEESDDEMGEEHKNWFWEYIVLTTYDSSWLDAFWGYITLYRQSKDDLLYLNIKDEVDKLVNDGEMSFKKAVAVVVETNKEVLTTKAACCEEKTAGDDLGFWHLFTNDGDINNGSSMLKRFERFMEVSHWMDNDELVQTIYVESEKYNEWNDNELLMLQKIFLADIMKQYQNGKENVDAMFLKTFKFLE